MYVANIIKKVAKGKIRVNEIVEKIIIFAVVVLLLLKQYL